MKHTKGKLIENSKAEGNIMCEETGRLIASCMGCSSNVNVNFDKIIEENLANAKRIIKCWNTYDELLEALIKAKKLIKDWHNMGTEDMGDGLWTIYEEKSPEMQPINNAIKKATE